MPTLLDAFSTVLAAFAPLVSRRVSVHARVLLVGTLLARGQRTVTAALRVTPCPHHRKVRVGLSDEADFVNYHRVLQRAVWSGLAISRTLLRLLVRTFAPTGTLVIGGDETIERRRGDQIKAKGTLRSRDPVRSSHSHFVQASGGRWVTLMLPMPIPFAERVWALPFLTRCAWRLRSGLTPPSTGAASAAAGAPLVGPAPTRVRGPFQLGLPGFAGGDAGLAKSDHDGGELPDGCGPLSVPPQNASRAPTADRANGGRGCLS